MHIEHRLKIYSFLKSIDIHITICFLEFLVYEINDRNASIHTHLLQLYFNEYESSSENNLKMGNVIEIFGSNGIRAKLNKLLDTSMFYDASITLDTLPPGNEYV